MIYIPRRLQAILESGTFHRQVGPIPAIVRRTFLPEEITMKKQSGFTLIELLLVLAIIGIISAIAIPALLGQRERAKAKATLGNADAVAGECARINDTLKENGTAAVATDVVTSVLALSNYQTPNTVNPYNAGTVPFTAGATALTGQVALQGTGYVDPATSQTYSAVIIRAMYLVGGVAKSTQKVVALD
jgi:prepilin-type N-terminal cleavage/methylation domain-containing protein